MLVERFGGSPFLVFLFDHWFGFFSLIFVLLVVFLSLFLPRIWRQTPAGFNPVLRVSGLDLWQASSLRRTALKEAAAGRTTEAVHAWRSAVVNSAADVDLIREGLGYVASLPQPPKDQMGFALNYSFWLLRLAGTNAADAELALRLLSKYGLEDYVVNIGSRLEDSLRPESAKFLAKSYFGQSRIEQFERLWKRHEAVFREDPELMLFHRAWQANWGPPATLQEGRLALAEATSNARLRLQALRLQLQVSYAMRDEATFAKTLRALEDEREARLSDHALHWLLMSALGRRDEARELARNFSNSPRTPAEARTLMMVLERLGLLDAAVSLGEQQLRTFGFDSELWLAHADTLIRAKRWEDLRTVAFSIRNELSLQGGLDGYSQYLEALAEMNLERPEAARAAADRLSRSTNMDPDLCRSIAREMLKIGFADVAATLLRSVEKPNASDAIYWYERTSAAFLSDDINDLAFAARKAYELNPADPSIMNNYAASLIVTRSNPAEAIQLTLKVLLGRPGDVASELNHILALLLNDRVGDAERALRQLNSLSLSSAEASIYHLAWFEVHMKAKDWAAARVAYGKIDPRKLVSRQATWLDEQYRSIPAG